MYVEIEVTMLDQKGAEMPTVIPRDLRKTFLDLPRAEAHAATDKFSLATFENGFKAGFEVTRRKDSPNGEQVNLLLYSKRED